LLLQETMRIYTFTLSEKDEKMNGMKGMLLIVMSALIMGGCTPGARYEHRLKRELASGVRYDSLFMGLSFGMTEDEFFDRCWEMNREKLVKQGISNQSVQYEMKKELKYPATMDFYPVFGDKGIIEMPVRFIYDGWAPWNKELSASNLAKDVRSWYEHTYGKGFITVEHPFKGEAYVKIDGNRRITIYIENDLYVWAIFTDMLAQAEKDSLGLSHQN
jgi:hypothetical protein